MLNCQLCITSITVMLHAKRCQIEEDVSIIPTFLCSKDVATIEAVWDDSEEGASPTEHFFAAAFLYWLTSAPPFQGNALMDVSNVLDIQLNLGHLCHVPDMIEFLLYCEKLN